MTILNQVPIVERVHYDPSKKEHRDALHTFITSNRWTLHFVADKDTTNLPYKLMVRTLIWYKSKENNGNI